MAVLDANFLIALEEKLPGALQRTDKLLKAGMALRVPATAWVEYLSGVPLKRRHQAMADLDETAFFEPFTRETAAIAIRLQAELLGRGARLAYSDLQIAATAIHYDEPLVSNDKDFDRVSGLARLDF